MRRWRVLSGLHRCEVLHPVGWIRRLRRIRHLTPQSWLPDATLARLIRPTPL
ncbi:hypothetical protein ACLB1O_04980 [Escherichia coli]